MICAAMSWSTLADRATRSDRTGRSHQPEERGMVADARWSHPAPSSPRRRRKARNSSLSGFSTRVCSPRIVRATCANNLSLETVVNRSVPMACGPNVDQAGRRGPEASARNDAYSCREL
jgi:hypothetical protein